MISSVLICDKGTVREINQDRAARFENGNCGLYLVADGMGGHYKGEMASQMVLDTMKAWWADFCADNPHLSIIQVSDVLRTLLLQAHERIREATPEGQLCGTTAVVLFLNGREYSLLSVGDSRCYLLPKAGPILLSMKQLTKDDVVLPHEPLSGKNAGKLLHAIGAGSNCKITIRTGRLPKAGAFALCTDGIYKFCSRDQIAAGIGRSLFGKTMNSGINRIVTEALKNKTNDNYSLIIVRFRAESK